MKVAPIHIIIICMLLAGKSLSRSTELFYTHVLSFSKRGQGQRGQKLIDRVLELDPENVDAMIVKAWVTMTEGKWGLAEQYYERALQRDPRNSETLYYYGKYWHQRGEILEDDIQITGTREVRF